MFKIIRIVVLIAVIIVFIEHIALAAAYPTYNGSSCGTGLFIDTTLPQSDLYASSYKLFSLPNQSFSPEINLNYQSNQILSIIPGCIYVKDQNGFGSINTLSNLNLAYAGIGSNVTKLGLYYTETGTTYAIGYFRPTGRWLSVIYRNSMSYDPLKLVPANVCPNPEAEADFLATCKDGLGFYDCYEPSSSTYDYGYETCDNIASKCIEQCGTQDEIAAFDCTDNGNGDLDIDTPCTCKEKSCANESATCISQCGGQENVLAFNCTDGVITIPCECTNPDIDISNGENPDKDITPQPIDPTDATNDKIVEAINEANRIAAKSANQSASDNASLGAKINQLGSSITGAFENIASGISSLLSGIQSTLSGIKNALTEGDYTPSEIGEAYTLPEVDFGVRLTEFSTTVKGSSLFSLPNSSFNVPGGGSSQLTIDGGQIFGVQTFDFADMSQFWTVLKSIVITAFSFVSLRVVCLKGGAS